MVPRRDQWFNACPVLNQVLVHLDTPMIVCDSTVTVPSDASSPAPPGGISIDYRQLPWTSRFLRDYCHSFERLEQFFRGSPQASGSWTAAFAERRALQPDAAVAKAVLHQLETRSAPVAAIANAELLCENRTVTVVTGQQAALFGGPLFTLLKAITAIKLARRLSDEHNTAVVPLFWIDAEDHDLDEIATCQVLDTNLAPVPVKLSLTELSGTTAASVELDESVAIAIAQLKNTLTPTAFTEAMLTALQTAYAPGVRLVDAFARWLDRLLGPHGLVVYDASEPATKPLARSVFARELSKPGETARLAAAAGAALETKGYHAQVMPPENVVALFRLDKTRLPIRTDAAGFRIGEHVLPADTLITELDGNPGSFSPSVLLRPITQDQLFPTVAYVAGPNEIAYLGQLREVYSAFNVPMPVIYPRASATVVDAATVRFLTRYDVDFARLQPMDDAALNALLSTQLPAEIDEAVTAAEKSVAQTLKVLESAVPTVDPTLTGAVGSTRGRMERDLRNLRGKIIQAAKRRDETLRRQFTRARAQSFPGGEPQERSVGSIYFLNRYGFAFVDRLLGNLPIEPGQHWLLTV